jgi:hypothetical protein
MISMKTLRKKFFVGTMNIMIPVMIILGTLIISVHAAGFTTVKVNPLSQTVTSGSIFTISIACVPGQTIKSFELQVVFNPSLLKANSVSKGSIFSSYSTFFNAGSIDNAGGTINNIYDVILGTGSTSSSGTLVTISFTAKSTSGTSSINLKNVGITNSAGYISISITNGSVQITTQSQQSNNPPVYTSMFPANQSSNIPISTTSLSLTIRDPEGKPFDYTIQTRPNVGSASVNNAGNGTKSCSLSGLKYETTYWWYVNATDGVNWKRCWYTFTTVQNPTNNPFILSGATPTNGATNVPISTSKITITVQNSLGHAFNMNIKTSPNIGSNSRTNAVNGIKTFSISGLTYSTTYTWYISCQDLSNGQWANQSYRFRTESNPASNNQSNGGGSSSNDSTPSTPDYNNPPNPPTQPSGPVVIEPGVSYYYTSSASDPDNDVICLRFDWGDGTYSNWTGFVTTDTTVSLSHMWMNESSCNISAIAQDEYGANSSWSDTLTVIVSQPESEEQPIINIIHSPNNISTNNTVQFYESGSVPDSTIVSYYWEFGDGNTSTSKKAVHTYTNPGQYVVNVTINDNSGETYTKKIMITVDSAAPVMAQNKMDFIPIILISSTIGIAIAFCFLFILFFRELLHLHIFKKYIMHGLKVIKQQLNTKNIMHGLKVIKQQLVFEITRIKHSISIKLKLIIKITNVKENETINTPLHYAPTENRATKIDDSELSYIHRMIDKITMES